MEGGDEQGGFQGGVYFHAAWKDSQEMGDTNHHSLWSRAGLSPKQTGVQPARRGSGRGVAYNTACNIKSASKSIVSILAGMASDQRHLDTNETIGKALGLSDSSTPSVLDLLRLTGGYPESSRKFHRIVKTSGDPVAASLKTRIPDLSRDSTLYSTIGVNLLGYAIAKAVEQPLLEFADNRLFSPLGIKVAYWPEDRAGNNISEADFFITARDFSRIGYLMLQEGVIQGDTLVSPAWIRTSTTPKKKVRGMDYGYLWWIDSGNFYAAGYKGQIMYISPESRSVVVIFADFDDYRESLALAKALTETIRDGSDVRPR